MVGSFDLRLRRVLVPGLAALFAAAGAAAADAARGGCVVVLDCPSGTQRVTANADGSFVLRDVPAEACTVAAAPAEAPAPSSKAAVVAPRDAASGLPTGKRQHAPAAAPAGPVCSVALDGAQATRSEDGASLRVSAGKGSSKELKGHVTLIK